MPHILGVGYADELSELLTFWVGGGGAVVHLIFSFEIRLLKLEKGAFSPPPPFTLFSFSLLSAFLRLLFSCLYLFHSENKTLFCFSGYTFIFTFPSLVIIIVLSSVSVSDPVVVGTGFSFSCGLYFLCFLFAK